MAECCHSTRHAPEELYEGCCHEHAHPELHPLEVWWKPLSKVLEVQPADDQMEG